MNADLNTFYLLLVALAIGLLIGVERGWQARDSEEGQRIAGVRTYGLIGLLGGVLGVLSANFGSLILGLGLIGLLILLGMFFLAKQLREGEWSITSLIAAILVYLLGALAVTGQTVIASSLAVVMVLLLSNKPVLHGWVKKLEAVELKAAIQLLLMSVVLLPVLPDQGYGPWQVLNPHKIWWMVVLIAGISFVGYFAIKIGGARRGILFTGLFGGLASSTAVTLHLSRLGKQAVEIRPVIASAVLIACGTMYIRMLILVAILNSHLLIELWLPVLVMAVLTYLPSLFWWHRDTHHIAGSVAALTNPLELRTALGFGLLLAVVMFLAVFLRESFGDAGILVLSAVSGIADVDAIVLSLIGMTESISSQLFVFGCVIAAAMNNLLKALMAGVIGGRELAIKISLPLVISATVGVALTLFLNFSI
ncbi:MAG: MgtC/SapB family protein [Methylophaga sp.]|nr:MgtC/SapB family protein [Methylophaga sp.]